MSHAIHDRPVIRVGLATVLVILSSPQSSAQPGVVSGIASPTATEITYRHSIEDFEGEVFLDTPSPAPGWYFKNTTNGGVFTWQVDRTDGADGSGSSLRMTVTEGVPYFYYLTDDQLPRLHDAAQFPTNRMRFHIRFPEGWRRTDPLPYNYNFHVGTYHRLDDASHHESNNWHFYHHLIFDNYESTWIEVDLPQWPQHQRSYKLNPGVNPTRPDVNFNESWTRTYFTGVPYFEQPQVDYPYDVGFDQWEFYYRNPGVATAPEYADVTGRPGDTIYHPVAIVHTHPTEPRRFGLDVSTQLFGGANWIYDVALLRDDDGDGRYQPGEDTVVTETPLLQPGEQFRTLVRVRIPASGDGSNDGDHFWTTLTAWQSEPAWQGDPHLDPGTVNFGVARGTPAASTQIRTRVASVLPPLDATPPGAVDDLLVITTYAHSARIGWTTVGDDGCDGEAFAHDIRFSTTPITPANFHRVTPFTDERAPQRCGAYVEVALPPLLAPDTVYHLAVATYDEVYNGSLSNVVSFRTQPLAEHQPPAVTVSGTQLLPVVGVADLDGSATDDGLPGAPLTYRWSAVQGPGHVIFDDEAAEDTVATFSVPGSYVLQLTAFDGELYGGAALPVTVEPDVGASTTLVVDLGASEAETAFGIDGWARVIKDIYTDYRDLGPGGTTIVVGDNGAYNYQGVSGIRRWFSSEETVVVTWFNDADASLTFTPQVSFDDDDRRISGTTGTWYDMTATTLEPGATGTTSYRLDELDAGTYGIVNITADFDNAGELVCDRIEIVRTGLSISELVPGLAGQDNALQLTEATPGESVVLFSASALGATGWPDCGQTSALEDPSPIATAVADGEGRVTWERFVGPELAGRVLYLQALERATCRASNVTVVPFPPLP